MNDAGLTHMPGATELANPMEWRRLCQSLATGPAVRRPAHQLVSMSRLELSHGLDMLAMLHVSGWLETLDQPDSDLGPLVILSPLGATTLRVEPYFRGSGTIPLWRTARRRRRPDRIQRPRIDDQVDVAQIADPHEPLAFASQTGRINDPYPDFDAPGEPRFPTFLIGLSQTWPASDCHHSWLPPNCYCLLCDLWGKEFRPRRRPRSEEAA